jgi:membrane fusion protein, copper/silver efflux system
MNNMKISAIVILALAAGLGLGYVIFPGNNPEVGYVEEPTMNKEDFLAADDQIWTCAMHPQVRTNEPGNCPICEMELIPLVANTSDDPYVLQMTRAAVKLLNVQTFVVGESEQVESGLVRFTGKVQADERLASSQVAHIPGRIEQLYVTYTGEEVKKGQALAGLYSPDLITAQQELIEALGLIDINPELVIAARNKLRFWRIPDDEIKRIEETKVVKENFTIYADEDGVVTKRRIAIGDYVKRGEPLYDMDDLSRVWILFDAYEDDLPYVKLDDKIEFNTPSVPNKSFTAPITFIDPFINPISRVAPLRTEMVNKGLLLKPEMFVYGTLKKPAGAKESLFIPKTAVLWTGKRSVVYVRLVDTEIPSFQFREIVLGAAVGGWYIVEDGLDEGEEIVTNGNFAIDAAAQLNNQVSMMNRNVGIKGDEGSFDLPDYTGTTSEEFKQQLSAVLEAYLKLKDAFVATDVALAKRATVPVIDAMNAMDMNLLKGAAHMYWMDEVRALTAHSEKIAELDDIEDQRTQFVFLSQAMVKSIKVYGIPENTYYVQHCPMANGGEGADWVSTMTKINNPYYGEAMISCGTTMDTITKDFRNAPMQVAVKRPPMAGHNH